MMEEKRNSQRLKDCNEIFISVISGRQKPSHGKKLNNYSKDISLSGVKICANTLLPVDTLLQIDFTLNTNTRHEQVTALGKVKWSKMIPEDEKCESGVEFVDTAGEAIRKLYDFISWKQKAISLYLKDMPFARCEN